ncbi:MAG: RNA polymerase sigma factor [Alphaproteobacteria bacterium]|nr:RNA polymerase sigma factor [Alphaproteobacteria bacterium]
MSMNRDALRREIVELLPRLRRYAYALTGARADADDLLQATVERVLTRGTPEDVALIKWSFRVCKNIWIDEIRARRVRVTAAASGKITEEEKVDGERVIMGKLAFVEVNIAMSKLPDDQRAVLSLVALDGCSYKQAAEILQTPIGTVMSRLARARRAIAVLLDEPTSNVVAIRK